MKRTLKWGLAIGSVIVGAAAYVGSLQATPASPDFSASTISVGRLAEFDVTHHAVFDDPDPDNSKKYVWLSMQQTKGPSDLFVQSNVWQPGAVTGWHTHPGHSL